MSSTPAASTTTPALDPVLLARIRRFVQHEPMVRGGITDPQELKNIKSYWSSRRTQVVESFVPKGETAAAPPPTHMLQNGCQRFIQRLLKIEYELLEAGHCFLEITPSTFVVDEYTGIPMMSPAALHDIVPMKPSERESMGGANMRYLADVIDYEVIGSDNPVPDEVGSGLLAMMRSEGFKRRYVIAHHSSLVPIENRLDLGLRMYQQLHDIVERLDVDAARGDWALYHVEAPATWHTDVQSNSYLKEIYTKSNYFPNIKGRRIRASAAHRFNRNASEHGLENAVDANTLTARYKRPDIARMLYAIFPLLLHSVMRALDRLRMIREIEIQSLFIYRE